MTSQITQGPPKQRGGWGVLPEPHARGGCILDVAAAVLHTLTDIGANGEIVMSYAFPIRETTEKTDVGRAFRFPWQRNAIPGVDPLNGPQSLYSPMKRGELGAET